MRYPYPGVIAPSVILLPIGMIVARFRVMPPEIKTLFWLLITSAFIYVLSTWLASNHHSNTLIVHIDTVIESLFLFRYFYLLIRAPAARGVIGYAAALFTLFCVFNVVELQGPARHNSYSRPVEALLMIGLGMYYWWQEEDRLAGPERPLVEPERPLRWTAIPANWVVSGLILYFTGSLFLFIFANFLAFRFPLAVNIVVWNIHATLVIIMYLLFAIGVGHAARKR